MARRKRFTEDDPAQSRRFTEAAKAEGIERVGPQFERAIGRIAPPKKGTPKARAPKGKRAKR